MPVRTISYREPLGPEGGFAQHEALYKAQCMEHCWGHLAPKQGRKYTGHLIFCVGTFGDLTVIDFEFKARGRALDSSPWLYEDLHRFIGDCVDDKRCEEGNVYRFAGLYCQSKKTGKYGFTGEVVRLDVSRPQPQEPSRPEP